MLYLAIFVVVLLGLFFVITFNRAVYVFTMCPDRIEYMAVASIEIEILVYVYLLLINYNQLVWSGVVL